MAEESNTLDLTETVEEFQEEQTEQEVEEEAEQEEDQAHARAGGTQTRRAVGRYSACVGAH